VIAMIVRPLPYSFIAVPGRILYALTAGKTNAFFVTKH
jgi:hypothetical protein